MLTKLDTYDTIKRLVIIKEKTMEMKKSHIQAVIGDRRFLKVALSLSIPIALQNLMTSSFSLVDTLMVGQLGDVELSAVGMASHWSWLMTMIMFGICSGTSVLSSQYWGAGNIKGIRKTLGISLTFGLLAAIVFASIGFFAPETVIRIFNRDEAVVRQGVAYLGIAVFSYPAIVISNILSATLRSTERVKIPMFVSAFTSVLNAVVNYGLIFGEFGMPEMGIAGAALATVISSWANPVLLIVLSVISKNILCCNPVEFFGFGLAAIKLFFSKAAPVIFNESIWGAGTFVFNVIFANIGYEYYAAVVILKTLENIAYAFYIGLCTACCVMLGKSIGAGEVKEAIRDSRRFAFLVPALGVIIGAILIVSRPYLIGLFNLKGNMGQITLDTAMWITLIYGFEMWIRNIPYIMIVGIFRSGGDTTMGMVFDTVFQWLIAIPATLVAAFVFKLPFPAVYWIMYVTEDIPKSISCVVYYLTDKWIKPVTDAGKEAIALYRKEKQSKTAK